MMDRLEMWARTAGRRKRAPPVVGMDLDVPDVPDAPDAGPHIVLERDLDLGPAIDVIAPVARKEAAKAEDGATLLTLSLDGSNPGSNPGSNLGSKLSRRRSFAGSLRAGSDAMAFTQLEAELARLERVARGAPTDSDTPLATPMSTFMPASASASASAPAPVPALFARGLEDAVPVLHAGAKAGVAEGVEAAVASVPRGVAGPAEAAFRTLLHQASTASERALLHTDHVDAAARTYASLHPAAKNLLRALADVRLKAADVAVAFADETAAVRLRSSVQLWEGARWATEDCYRRTRDLHARRTAWTRGVDAHLETYWGDLGGRVRELANAWNQVVAKYDAVLRVACGETTALDVGRFLATSSCASPSPSVATSAATSVATSVATSAATSPALRATQVQTESELEALRRSIANFLDSWAARDTDVRAACLTVDAAQPTPAQLAAAEGALATLHAQLASVEAGIEAARRRIIEAQKTQLARVMLTGGASDGMALASTLAAAAELQTGADAEIDALYAERRRVKTALADAGGAVDASHDAVRARAAGVVLKTHARWRDAARKAADDVAALEQEVALLRIFRASQLGALKTEVAAEHERILASARTAYTACESQAGVTLDQALASLAGQRAGALAALEASEGVLGTELHALMASVSSAGLAVGMPMPAVKMVDDTMRTAVAERLGRATVRTLRDHASALQPVADGLAAGLPRPAAVD